MKTGAWTSLILLAILPLAAAEETVTVGAASASCEFHVHELSEQGVPLDPGFCGTSQSATLAAVRCDAQGCRIRLTIQSVAWTTAPGPMGVQGILVANGQAFLACGTSAFLSTSVSCAGATEVHVAVLPTTCVGLDVITKSQSDEVHGPGVVVHLAANASNGVTLCREGNGTPLLSPA